MNVNQHPGPTLHERACGYVRDSRLNENLAWTCQRQYAPVLDAIDCAVVANATWSLAGLSFLLWLLTPEGWR